MGYARDPKVPRINNGSGNGDRPGEYSSDPGWEEFGPDRGTQDTSWEGLATIKQDESMSFVARMRGKKLSTILPSTW